MKSLYAATVFVFLILGPHCSYAQGIIHGYVLDSLTMDQLKGAEVTLTGTSFSAVSNTDGKFRITGIPPGDYIVRASYLGYEGKKYLINVKSEETQALNIQLVPVVTAPNGMTFTDQGRSQAEEINMQIRSNTVDNIISGKKLQEMPDENIATALNRLPGVSIAYVPSVQLPASLGFSISSGGGNIDIPFPPMNDFTLDDDPVSRVLIRGLDYKYSNITIDKISIPPTSSKDKSINLDLFSERGFRNIELSKTITSDEDGDATAGSINLATGQAPYKRVIQAELLGNDNRLANSANQYDFTGSYGERFFSNTLGVRVDANVDKKILSSEFEDKTQNGALLSFASPSLFYTNAVRKRNEADVLLDFTTPDGGSIRFNNILDNVDADYFGSEVDDAQWYPADIFRDREVKQEIFLSSFGGSNYLFGFDVDWNAAFSESQSDHPLYYSLVFHVPGSESFIPSTSPGSSLDYSLDTPSRNYCKERTASIDIRKKYILSNEIESELKFGGKYMMSSRSYDEISRVELGSTYMQYGYRRLANDTLVADDFAGTRFAGLEHTGWGHILLSYFQDVPPGERGLFGKFDVPLINESALRLWRQLTYSPYYFTHGADINSYDFSEGILAGYAMDDLNFGKWAEFIAGVRIESEQNDYSGYYFPTSATTPAALYNNTPKRTGMYHYDKITTLPNFQMILRPTDFLNLRLATYKTLIRPDCYARMPRIFSAHVSGFTVNGADAGNYLNMGNPDLQNADVWNYEVQTQFYSNVIGQFSIDMFYKDIKGMVQATDGVELSRASTLDSLGINWSSFPIRYPFNANSYYNLYTYFNTPKPTRIWGFEIEHQANFRYLPGLLKNIVLNYNFTILRSETWKIDVMGIDTTYAKNIISYKEQGISDMPQLLANVNLGYDIEGFSFRISYFFQGACPISGTAYGLQIREDKFARLDVAVRQQILRNIFIVLNANNITNSPEEVSFRQPPSTYEPGTPWQTAQAYRTGMNIDFGVGADF